MGHIKWKNMQRKQPQYTDEIINRMKTSQGWRHIKQLSYQQSQFHWSKLISTEAGIRAGRCLPKTPFVSFSMLMRCGSTGSVPSLKWRDFIPLIGWDLSQYPTAELVIMSHSFPFFEYILACWSPREIVIDLVCFLQASSCSYCAAFKYKTIYCINKKTWHSNLSSKCKTWLHL